MQSRPNIVLITTDQHRGDCLSVAKSSHPVMTPHLDQLAREGIRFERAYTDCPLCVPARMTIMTGKCAYTHGAAGHEFMDMPEEDHKTLAGRLTSAGYQTQAVGKMHFHPARARYGFERTRIVLEDYVNWLEGTPYAGGYRGHGVAGNEVYPTYSPVPEAFYHTRWTVDESIQFLEQRDPRAPFFMWTSFEAPHPPFDPPESAVRLYDDTTIPSPVIADWAANEETPAWFAYTRMLYNLDLLNPQTIQTIRKHYYAQITHVDYELGRLFGSLRDRGLWDNTIIVFASDHGEMLGDHGLFHKSCFYDPSARVPFILRLPESMQDQLQPGQVVQTPVTLADLYPTLLTLAGALHEGDMAGRDGMNVMDLLNNDGNERWVFGYRNDLHGLYMATNGRWKYLYYVADGEEQLFDLSQDPNECDNLAGQSAHGDRLATCRCMLLQQFKELADETGQSDTGLKMEQVELDESRIKAMNPMAWWGPIRYGGLRRKL